MKTPSLRGALPFFLCLLAAAAASAQPLPAAPEAPAAKAPATSPAMGPTTELPPSKIQLELERRLGAMQAGAGLTSTEVAQRAVANSYALQAKRHALAATDAGVSQAKAAYWPQLTASARYTRLSPIQQQNLGSGALVGVADPTPHQVQPGEALFAAPFEFLIALNQYELNLRLDLPLSDYLLRYSQATGAAKHSRSSAEFDERATKLSVARDARAAYYHWVRMEAQLLIAVQAVEQAQGHLTDAKNAFQAGLVSRADVLRAEADLQNALLFEERAKNASTLGALQLSIMMRDNTSKSYEVGENLFSELPALAAVPPPDAAYQEALTKRPELRSLEAAESALRQQAKVARAGNYPRLDAQANLTYANPNQRYFPQREEWNATWDVSAILSWTPTAIPGAQAASSVAEARAAEISSQRAALREALKLEVNQAIQAAGEARFSITASDHALRAAEESYRVRRELFRAGRATMVEVTDAETELTRARLEAIDARVNARLSLVALNHALGRDANQR